MPNKINPYSEFAIQVQSEVIHAIGSKTQSTNDLARALNRPYHTVRQAVLELENNGNIVPVNKSYRNTKYKVADGTVVTDRIIPTVLINDEPYKITRVINNWKRETKAEQASRNLPMYITRIFKVAKRLHEGEKGSATSLQLVRREMEADRDAITNLLNVYNQILKNGKIWSPEHLENFPNDTEWDQTALDQAYKHFFEASSD